MVRARRRTAGGVRRRSGAAARGGDRARSRPRRAPARRRLVPAAGHGRHRRPRAIAARRPTAGRGDPRASPDTPPGAPVSSTASSPSTAGTSSTPSPTISSPTTPTRCGVGCCDARAASWRWRRTSRSIRARTERRVCREHVSIRCRRPSSDTCSEGDDSGRGRCTSVDRTWTTARSSGSWWSSRIPTTSTSAPRAASPGGPTPGSRSPTASPPTAKPAAATPASARPSSPTSGASSRPRRRRSSASPISRSSATRTAVSCRRSTCGATSPAVIRRVRPQRVLCQSPERNYQRIYASHPIISPAVMRRSSAVYPDARNPFAHPELLDEGFEAWVASEVYVMTPTRGRRCSSTSPTRSTARSRRCCSHTSQMPDPAGTAERMRAWGQASAEAAGLPPGHLAEGFLRVETA